MRRAASIANAAFYRRRTWQDYVHGRDSVLPTIERAWSMVTDLVLSSTRSDGPVTSYSYDGSTPISYATSTLTLDVSYGAQGVDHQTTTSGGTGANGTGSGSTTATAWYHLDAQGTPRALSDASGKTTAASAYADYGTPQPDSGTLYAGPGNYPAGGQAQHSTTTPVLPSATSVSPLGYASQQANPCVGLLHFPARDYSPATASWLSADSWPGSLVQPQTQNGYSYVVDDPTNRTDPTGHYSYFNDPDALPAGPSNSYIEQTPCGASDCDPGATLCTGQCAEQTPCAHYACDGNYAPPTDAGYDTSSGTAGCPSCDPAGWSSPTSQQSPTSGTGQGGYNIPCTRQLGLSDERCFRPDAPSGSSAGKVGV